ncbi:MAG: hypothetical protein GY828_07990, partial [Candidatus Gracilibacteria bacterium]|nr:hypothetical protein [Candidatus Gracilibacteria bacterium]
FAVVFLLLGTVGYFTYENNVNIAEQVAKEEKNQKDLANTLADVDAKATEILNKTTNTLESNIGVFKSEVNPKLEALEGYVETAKEKVESMNATFDETTTQLTEKGGKVIEEIQQNGSDAIAEIKTKNKSLIVKTVNDVIQEKNLVTAEVHEQLEKSVDKKMENLKAFLEGKTIAEKTKILSAIKSLRESDSENEKRSLQNMELSADMKEYVCRNWLVLPRANDLCE